MADFPLKYLFIAEFSDGSQYVQDKNDVSKLDPKRSQFYDVLQSGKKIVKFSLVYRLFGVQTDTWTVDLVQGTFEHNGKPFGVQLDQGHVGIKDFTLYFFRNHERDLSVTYDLESGNVLKAKNAGHRIKYLLGFTYEFKGAEYKRVIEIPQP